MKRLNHTKYPIILNFKQKHGELHFICNSQADLFKAALHVFNDRVKAGHWYFPPSEDRAAQPDYATQEEVDQLKGPAKEAAQKELKQYQRHLANLKEQQDDWEEIQDAAKLQDGQLAYFILDRHSGYEYEKMQKIYPTPLD